MASDIRERLEQAIRDEEEKRLNRLRASHERASATEEMFEPVRLVAEELREYLQSIPSIKFAVNPDSVWIALSDRDLKLSFDEQSNSFVGEEGAHAWYDGEPYADRYAWDTSAACIDAMIRFCARYVRMARAISAGI